MRHLVVKFWINRFTYLLQVHFPSKIQKCHLLYPAWFLILLVLQGDNQIHSSCIEINEEHKPVLLDSFQLFQPLYRGWEKGPHWNEIDFVECILHVCIFFNICPWFEKKIRFWYFRKNESTLTIRNWLLSLNHAWF